jgi:alpha-tubulin suppressor-like RCC1 family protein
MLKHIDDKLVNIEYIACGAYHNVALRTDNKVIVWSSDMIGCEFNNLYINEYSQKINK